MLERVPQCNDLYQEMNRILYKKKDEEEEGKKPSSVSLARGRGQLWFHDIRGWNAEEGKCIAVCIHVIEFLFPMHNIQS